MYCRSFMFFWDFAVPTNKHSFGPNFPYLHPVRCWSSRLHLPLPTMCWNSVREGWVLCVASVWVDPCRVSQNFRNLHAIETRKWTHLDWSKETHAICNYFYNTDIQPSSKQVLALYPKQRDQHFSGTRFLHVVVGRSSWGDFACVHVRVYGKDHVPWKNGLTHLPAPNLHGCFF